MLNSDSSHTPLRCKWHLRCVKQTIKASFILMFVTKNDAHAGLACVADETKPQYSLSANQQPKACSTPRVLPGFFVATFLRRREIATMLSSV